VRANFKKTTVGEPDVGGDFELRCRVQNLNGFTRPRHLDLGRTGTIVQIALNSIDIEQDFTVLLSNGVGCKRIWKDGKGKLNLGRLTFILSDKTLNDGPCPVKIRINKEC
jgi:hypothetical protein